MNSALLALLAARAAAPPPGVGVAYHGVQSSASDAATHTFAGMPIGTPGAGRVVVVAIGATATGSRSVTAVTIGGVPATLDAQSGAQWRHATVASAVVPTGATADVVVTLNVAAGCSAATYSLPSGATVVGTASATEVSNPSADTTASGATIAVAALSSTAAVTWSGASVDHSTTVGTRQHTAAHGTASAVQVTGASGSIAAATYTT